jgi:hypothetical protein
VVLTQVDFQEFFPAEATPEPPVFHNKVGEGKREILGLFWQLVVNLVRRPPVQCASTLGMVRSNDEPTSENVFSSSKFDGMAVAEDEPNLQFQN